MKTAIETIIKDVLTSVYQPFGFSLWLAILFMYCYLEIRDKQWIHAVREWVADFRGDKQYRKVFFFVLYTSVLLYISLSCESMWRYPLGDIFGGWTIYNSKGELSIECIQNFLAFIPFIPLWFGVRGYAEKSFWKIIRTACRVTLFCSLGVEGLQLLFRLRNVRIADVVYNVLGGLIGGVIYYLWFHRRKGESDES